MEEFCFFLHFLISEIFWQVVITNLSFKQHKDFILKNIKLALINEGSTARSRIRSSQVRTAARRLREAKFRQVTRSHSALVYLRVIEHLANMKN